MSIVLYREPGFTQAQNDAAFAEAVMARDRALDCGDFDEAERQQVLVEKRWEANHPPELVYYDSDMLLGGQRVLWDKLKELMRDQVLTPDAVRSFLSFLGRYTHNVSLANFLNGAIDANERVRVSY